MVMIANGLLREEIAFVVVVVVVVIAMNEKKWIGRVS